MSRIQASVLAALACLVAAGCSMLAEPQSGTDTRTRQDRPVDQPDGMKGGGGSGGGGM
jgi:hypothetical protein